MADKLITDDEIFLEIRLERKRQKKWGESSHSSVTWSIIAGEEDDEARQAFFQGDIVGYLAELIQATAVRIAWIKDELEHYEIDLDDVENRLNEFSKKD